VLPTYNRAYILKRAVDSILNQTFKDFELIIVDDGSTDNTKALIDSFSDSRIKYVKHDKNKGLAASRNTGIISAQGAFIANQDSDDIWFSEKLEKELAVFESAPSDIGIVYSRLKKHFNDNRVEFYPHDKQSPKEGNLHKTLLKRNFITMQCALIKKECFKDEMFDESLPALQDWDLWIRISKKWKFKYVPYIGCEAFVSPDSITKKRKVRAQARKTIFYKHKKDFEKYSDVFAKLAYMIATSELRWGDRKLAKEYLYEAWQKQPFNIRYLLKFLSS